jgi:hypothetical protein
MVGRNQLIRMENAMLFPSGRMTAAHQADTQVVTNATTGLCLAGAGNGTYTAYSAPGNGNIYSQPLDTGENTPVDMTLGGIDAEVGSRIVGVSRAVRFLGKDYCPNPNSNDTYDGILNLTDKTLIAVTGSTATAQKLRIYLNRLWLIFSDGTIRFSDNGDATTWNALNTFLLPSSEPIIDFHPVQGGAVVYGSNAINAMYGSDRTDISFNPLMQESPQSPKNFTTGSTEVNGIVYILGDDGIYAASLNGVQAIPHTQHTFFQEHADIFTDPDKTGITAAYLKRFQAIIFSWPEYYKIGGQSLVFYLSGAYSKLNKLLPTDFPYLLPLNDKNTDYLIGLSTGVMAKSSYPTVNSIRPQITYIQTRHEDCDSYRDKVWSCFIIVSETVVYGVTLTAFLDESEEGQVVQSDIVLVTGENHIWLDELPRSKTLSLLITINNTTTVSIVNDYEEQKVITDELGNEFVSGLNPGNWSIKELRLRYREAGPAL